MRKLSDQEVASHLDALPEWRIEKGELTRTFTFPNIFAWMAFADRVSEQAVEAGQSGVTILSRASETDIRYNYDKVALVSHNAGGLTAEDFEQASIVDKIFCLSNRV
jgi:4a-hydroxytetrahydrobiopterin dehydratase